MPTGTVPGYEVLDELGRGAMGVVYRARQLSLKRPVALKMLLHAGHASPEQRARFRAEAEAVARLQHPNIVQVYEVGEVEGHLYCSLELVGGGSLAQRLTGTPLLSQQPARLTEVLARAVQAAHERGVIHRDLKPANVLLTEDGVPKVADFGLAKRADAPSVRTQSGAVVGTPSYMAPEQAAGESVGPSADVYALGAVLYECLTGRPPFQGATVLDTLLLVRTQEPVPPSRLQPRVPRDLETICLKCLEKAPARRFGSALALAEDLRRFLDGRPIQARPVGAWVRLAKWARRRPALATSVAVSALALVGLLGMALLWNHSELRAERERAEEANAARTREEGLRRRAQEGEGRAEGRAAELRRSVFNGRLLQASALEGWDPGRALRALLDPEGCPAELRDFTWAYVARRCRRDRLTLRAPGELGRGLAFAPDGRTLAAAVRTGPQSTEVWLWETDTGRKRAVLRGLGANLTGIAFSPDGRLLASAALAGPLRLWDLATGKEKEAFDRPPGGARALAFSREGLLAWAGPGGVTLREVGGREQRTLPAPRARAGWAEGARRGPAAAVGCLAFSADGKLLAGGETSKGWGVETHHVWVWDVKTGEMRTTFPAHTDIVGAVAFAPDGKTLASCGNEGMIKLWDLASGKPTAAIDTHTPRVTSVAFSPDGRTLAYCGDGRVRLCHAATGEEKTVLAGPAAGWAVATYSPDGRTLATAFGAIRDAAVVTLWETAVAQGRTVPAAVWQPRQQRFGLFAYDRQLRTVAREEADGSVSLWDVGADKERARLSGLEGPLWAAVFSPDGRSLVTVGSAPDGRGPAPVRLWDAVTGRERARLPAPHRGGASVAFAPDGRTLATGGDGVVVLWDAATGRALARREVARPGVGLRVDFARGGRVVTASPQDGKGTVRAWEAPDGREVEGRFLRPAARDGDVVQLFDPDSGERRTRLRPVPPGARGPVLSPNGRRVAFLLADFTVKLWDAATGEGEVILRGHEQAVQAVAFAPDGRVVATAGRDGTVRLWDPVTGQERAAFRGPRDGLERLGFTPDGATLYLEVRDRHRRTLILWDAAPVPGGPPAPAR
jgi:WD40 repeat protein